MTEKENEVHDFIGFEFFVWINDEKVWVFDRYAWNDRHGVSTKKEYDFGIVGPSLYGCTDATIWRSMEYDKTVEVYFYREEKAVELLIRRGELTSGVYRVLGWDEQRRIICQPEPAGPETKIIKLKG